MSKTEPDVIDLLAGVEKGSRLDRVRAQRQQARDNAQKSYRALFAPEFPGGMTAEERYAVAAFVAGLHREDRVVSFYMDGLAAQGASPDLSEAIRTEIMRGAADGPYGRYPLGPLTLEDKAGPVHRISEANRRIFGARLSAALEHAHLLVFHPRDASPAALQSLLDAGWSTTDIVTLSQLVAFLSFQIRVIAGLSVLAASPGEAGAEIEMTDTSIASAHNDRPLAFTQDEIGWTPWLQPLAEDELTERHWAGLVDGSRAKSPYFMLLARDPEILEARTKTDKDIFYNPAAGLPRAERELSAAAVSRENGCIFCASVHARFASTYSKRREDVQRLLDEGVAVDIDERWNAVIAASVAITDAPAAFDGRHVERLRQSGLDDLAIADVIYSAAFFNWANRLMLSLGEPTATAQA